VLGAPERGEALAGQMRARRDAIVQAVADAPRPSLYYEMDASDPSKPFAAGPNGFYGQLVDLAGATNIFADLPGDFGQVSAESVVARDPTLIVLADAYLPYNAQSPALVAARPGWSQITAVLNQAIYAVDGDIYSSPSPRLVDGLESLAFLLHPDRFADSGGPRLVDPDRAAPFCAEGMQPSFTFGFASLSEALGTTMGDPTECPHVDVANGDTYQQTSKGLAIYRRARNLPIFTSGADHWALTAAGLVSWSGPGLEPPAAE
jgi:hypothetical protein